MWILLFSLIVYQSHTISTMSAGGFANYEACRKAAADFTTTLREEYSEERTLAYRTCVSSETGWDQRDGPPDTTPETPPPPPLVGTLPGSGWKPGERQ